jgi:hypothetical protein
MDIGKHHGRGHTMYRWSSSLDMNMEMEVYHGHGHVLFAITAEGTHGSKRMRLELIHGLFIT